jgi:STELLO glycosyltransferases
VIDERWYVVVTSIFEPTPAVRAYATIAHGRLVVVGDKKSPSEWHCEGVEYLGPETQNSLGYALADALPWNHYARKMLGYLRAAERGADVIVDTDDDNVPHESWSFPAFEAEFAEASGVSFYNVYRHYTDDFVWPRGFPLRLVRDTTEPSIRPSRPVHVGIWQALADGDPDVDAIYRLVAGSPVEFRQEDPVVLASGTVCPFNSQNTAFRREVFPLLFLPAFVTFRFTDILRSLVAQPILWAAGLQLGFTMPTVAQDRNPHDLLDDFESEIPMYLNTERAVDVVQRAVEPSGPIEQNLRAAYAALAECGIVEADELRLLDTWLADLGAITPV